MMKLRTWMEAAGWSQMDLADELGVSQAHISRVLAGRRGASDRLKTLVHSVTGGEVTPADWFTTHERSAQ